MPSGTAESVHEVPVTRFVALLPQAATVTAPMRVTKYPVGAGPLGDPVQPTATTAVLLTAGTTTAVGGASDPVAATAGPDPVDVQ